MTPEEKARQEIDKLLVEAGWIIQDRVEFNRFAGVGVAVREFLMADNTEADYLLFVDGKAVGVIEAKKSDLTLSGVETQSQGYACNLPEEQDVFKCHYHLFMRVMAQKFILEIVEIIFVVQEEFLLFINQKHF